MGLFTAFFVARPAEASMFELGAEYPLGESADYSRITTVDLGALLACVRGIDDWESERLDDEFVSIYEESDEGPWIFRFPEDLIESLAKMEESAVPVVARGWWELVADQFEADDCERIVKDLRRLALNAAQSDKSLFVYIAL